VNDSRHPQKKSGVSRGVLAASLAAFIFAGLALTLYREDARIAYEDISFAIFPSANLAFYYGEAHFSASTPAAYDINRAEYFFEKAAVLDPQLPYVHHELARIAFLRGDFVTALAQIDQQIALEGDKTPKSYYVRGLIEGYAGDYADSANDYEHFLQFDPHDWAGINDYSWVLLKAGRIRDAAATTAGGLMYFPDNPWLLNTNATALYDLGDYRAAHDQIEKALAAVTVLSPSGWSQAYPGNDPAIAAEGVAAFQKAVAANAQTIDEALASSTGARLPS
jgi:tetratricopeptide (TPR) repeat protein